MIKLSIIIPIYNSEKYLERCVDSCLNQGLSESEYEILLCNDGSTDNGPEIAKELANKHNCIKIFSQENQGAGMARNLGLQHAKGQYVMFVDSDDYIKPNSLSQPLCSCLEMKLDVCRYGLINILINTGESWPLAKTIESGVLYNGKDLISNPNVPFDTACSALYRMDFLLNNQIEFSKLSSSEDVYFTLNVYLYAERIMYVDTEVYVYEIKDKTRGHPKDINGRVNFIKNDISIAAAIQNASKNKTIADNTKKMLKLRSTSSIIGSLLSLRKLRHELYRDSVIDIIEHSKKLGVYPIKGRSFSWKSTLFAHILLNQTWLLLAGFKKNKT